MAVRPLLAHIGMHCPYLRAAFLALCFWPVPGNSNRSPRNLQHHKFNPNHDHAQGVPHIIHQSWKTKEDIPERFLKWQASWKEMHPTWEYRLWSDEENLEFVEEHYPWFLETYNSFTAGVMRADSCRYLYMYHYGGVYADMDFHSLQPLDDMLVGKMVVLGRMRDVVESWDEAVPNAWMASKPGHPFWLFCVGQMVNRAAVDADRYAETHDYSKQRYGVVGTTGPIMLWQTLKLYGDLYPTSSDITILPTEAIYPVDWIRTGVVGEPLYVDEEGHDYRSCDPNEPQYNREECKQMFPTAYAITFWTHSWR